MTLTKSSDLLLPQKELDRLFMLTKQKRLSSCYLFWGPNGTGKKQAAYLFAASIIENYSQHPHTQAKLKTKQHPDIHLITPMGKTGLHAIEDIREMTQKAFLQPFEAQKKVFIIEDGDRMLASSANALLKTFEEPPLDTVFIITCDEKKKLLPTVSSRCQKIAFKPIEFDVCLSFLEQNFSSKTSTQLNALAHYAKGGLQKALDLAEDEEFWTLREQLFQHLINPHLDYLCLLEFAEALEAWVIKDLEPGNEGEESSSNASPIQKEWEKKKKQAQHFLKQKQAFEDFLELYLSFYRDLMAYQLKAPSKTFINQELDLLFTKHPFCLDSLDPILAKVEKASLAFQRSVKVATCCEYLML